MPAARASTGALPLTIVPDALSRHPDMALVGAEGGAVNAANGDVPLL